MKRIVYKLGKSLIREALGSTLGSKDLKKAVKKGAYEALGQIKQGLKEVNNPFKEKEVLTTEDILGKPAAQNGQGIIFPVSKEDLETLFQKTSTVHIVFEYMAGIQKTIYVTDSYQLAEKQALFVTTAKNLEKKVSPESVLWGDKNQYAVEIVSTKLSRG